MSIKEQNALVEFQIARMTYPKLMEIMKSLKDDHVTRNGLLDAIRNYIVDDKKDQFQTKQERVCNALMLAIFRYVETEVRNG